MTTAVAVDPVRVLALALHEAYCLPGANPFHRYSERHREQDMRMAQLVDARLAASGVALSPTS